MPSGRRGAAGVRLVLDTNVVVSALIWGRNDCLTWP